MSLLTPDKQISRRLGISIIRPRDGVAGQIGLAGYQVHPHLIGLEKSPHPVVVGLGQGIILVVVAFGAIERQPQERLADMLHGLVEPLVAVEEKVVPREETSGPQLLEVVGVRFVGGEHEADHLVIGQVGIERLDDPITPVPQVPRAVAVLVAEAPRVAVAPHVHPMTGPAFPVARVFEQSIHRACVALFGRVAQGLPHLGFGGRQPDEVEVQATDLEASRGLGPWGQSSGFMAPGDEGIDGVPHPIAASHCRYGRALAGSECPMIPRIRFGGFARRGARSVRDPLLQQRNLSLAEGLALVFGRHALVGVGARRP